MKSLTLTLIFLVSASAHAEFRTADEAITKLKSYKAEDFHRKSEADDEKVDAREDRFFDDLDEAVKFATTQKAGADLYQALAEATALSLKADDTGYAGEVVLPAYKKNKKQFRDALKKLPKKDAEQVEKTIQEKEHETKSGNG